MDKKDKWTRFEWVLHKFGKEMGSVDHFWTNEGFHWIVYFAFGPSYEQIWTNEEDLKVPLRCPYIFDWTYLMLRHFLNTWLIKF